MDVNNFEIISAVIFVVDSSNRDRLDESKNELAKLVQEKELKEAALLILANKQVEVQTGRVTPSVTYCRVHH